MIWDWLTGSVPWWVWAALGLFAALVVFRLLGWKGALAALTATAGAVLYTRGKQSGREMEREKEKRDAERAIDAAERARLDARRRDVDDDRLRESDGWKRDGPV